MYGTALPASGSVMPRQNMASPEAASGSQRSFMASFPRCSIARGAPLKMSWQRMADETSARASSSRTIVLSTSVRPAPPYSSPTVTPKRPASAIARQESCGNSSVSSQCAARGASSRSATSRASLRRAD